jgi:hypothetical protein
VKCVANSADFDLTHYYIFQDGTSLIYMATNTVTEPSVGELRFIARLVGVPEAYKEGDVSNTDGGTAIEGSDVFLVGSQTRSKVCPAVNAARTRCLLLTWQISSILPSVSLTTMYTVLLQRTILLMRASFRLCGHEKPAAVVPSSETSI